MRMLLVDDDPTMLETICSLVSIALPTAGIETAASAREAIARIERAGVDCIVSDVVMETPDAGWALARRARARGIRILLLSADDRAPWLAFERGIPLVHKAELSLSTVESLLTGFLSSDTG